ncbi:MAG: hypothetical protein CEE42_00030 [Promethearchaeota archaeon Loki_b31]|nr:MAG: hypothetical protein CEE42_00030 [Candidatus Lokiarchaeota archaeon Loki_b31]
MVLNWTPEVIVEIFTSITIFVAVLLTYFEPRTKKIRSLFFIRMALIFMVLYFVFDLLANLFLSTTLARLYPIMLFPTSMFFIIGINFMIKETINSIILILTFGAGVLLCYLAFQPDAVGFEFEWGYLTVNPVGMFEVLEDFLVFLLLIPVFYWGLKTWLNAPFLIRKEALIFFIGIIIATPITAGVFIFYYWDPSFILYSDITLSLGVFIMCIAIFMEPKLLYILPFTVYRIVVKDNEGYPLFDHDWSESGIDEPIFTGFINAVQIMSEEVMKIGGLVNIDLTEGILILNESEYITVGLVASKSSRLLRNALTGFTKDFEVTFQRNLKKSIRDKKEYATAYSLIEKYFSNFPSKLIKSRKEPFLLMTKYKELPFALEKELRDIIGDESKFQMIKEELMNSPYGVLPTFFNLYDELKDKPDTTSEEESK